MTRIGAGVMAAMAAALLCWGCGDDAGDDGGGSAGAGSGPGANAARDACHAQCDAQEQVMGCEPLVELAVCKQLCNALVADLEAECHEPFASYYDCSAKQGFMCLGSLVSQDSAPCKSAMDQFNACKGTPMCAGANDRGLCPRVDCPCPEGAKSVSGFDNEGGQCSCFDARTCVDFFCD